MKRLIPIIAICGLALALNPTLSNAQDGTATIMMSASQCSTDAVGDVFDNLRETVLPVAQELADEGMIESWGVLSHWWGDEWNLVQIIVGADEAAIVAANGELGSRLSEQYPDDETFIENCPRHRDGFYTGISATSESDDDEDNGDGNAVAMSYFQCDYRDLGDIAAADREDLGVYQGMVDEGLIRFRASMTHSWADEWNYITVVAADDIPSMLDGISEAGDRIDALEGDDEDDSDNPFASCTVHKDNIYVQVMWTD